MVPRSATDRRSHASSVGTATSSTPRLRASATTSGSIGRAPSAPVPMIRSAAGPWDRLEQAERRVAVAVAQGPRRLLVALPHASPLDHHVPIEALAVDLQEPEPEQVRLHGRSLPAGGRGTLAPSATVHPRGLGRLCAMGGPPRSPRSATGRWERPNVAAYSAINARRGREFSPPAGVRGWDVADEKPTRGGWDAPGRTRSPVSNAAACTGAWVASSPGVRVLDGYPEEFGHMIGGRARRAERDQGRRPTKMDKILDPQHGLPRDPFCPLESPGPSGGCGVVCCGAAWSCLVMRRGDDRLPRQVGTRVQVRDPGLVLSADRPRGGSGQPFGWGTSMDIPFVGCCRPRSSASAQIRSTSSSDRGDRAGSGMGVAGGGSMGGTEDAGVAGVEMGRGVAAGLVIWNSSSPFGHPVIPAGSSQWVRGTSRQRVSLLLRVLGARTAQAVWRCAEGWRRNTSGRVAGRMTYGAGEQMPGGSLVSPRLSIQTLSAPSAGK